MASAEMPMAFADRLDVLVGTFALANVAFPSAGEYTLVLSADGVPFHERRLYVQRSADDANPEVR